MISRVEERAIVLLQERKLNKYDLAQAAPCHQRTAQRVLAKLHRDRFIRICGWDRAYYVPIPRYAKGCGNDVSRPDPVPMKIAQRRRRKDPEVRWEEMMNKRKKRALKK